MWVFLIAFVGAHGAAPWPCLEELADIAVTPSSNATLWNVTHNVTSPEWDGRLPARPAFVALPRSTHDIQRCLQCATRHKVRVSVKNGGHSFGGYSSVPASDGFMINLYLMTETSDIGDCGPSGVSTVTVQAGANWYDVYHAFGRSGKEWIVNGGLCPTVGVTGFTLGGGTGPAARKYGLGVDAVQSLTMVTIDGQQVVEANETSNPDLFWALRGGGGGNFGVVTEMTLRIHAGPDLYTFGKICFKWSQAVKLLDAVQRFDSALPREVSLDVVIGKDGSCLWITSQTPMNTTRKVIAPILQAQATTEYQDELSEWDCYWHGICHYKDQHGYSEYDSDPEYSKNCLLDSISPDLTATLVNLTESAPAGCSASNHFIAFGGKVNEIASNATAFPWRTTKFMVYTGCSYTAGDEESRQVAKEYVNAWQARIFPFCNGGSYVNFIDPLAPGVERYYGEALPQLQKIKRQWIPSGFNPLRFPMEIPTDETMLQI